MTTLIIKKSCLHISNSFISFKLLNFLKKLCPTSVPPSQFQQQYCSKVKIKTNIMESLTATSFDYPIASKNESIYEEFHDVKVPDIYRSLEDPDSDSTQAYVNAQNDITRPFLESSGEWQKINAKLTKLWNYEKFTCPTRHGDKYFFYKNTGLQNQNVLYQQNTLNDDARVFLDPNTLSDDGTIALSCTCFSEDGKYFAFGLSQSGSDWIKIKVKDVESGVDFDESLEKVKFSTIAWTKDNLGFFYGQYPDQCGKTDGSETKQNENQKLYYHRVGEPQSQDILIAEFPDEPSWRIGALVSDCGKYLIMVVVKDCRDNIVFYADLQKAGELRGKLQLEQIVYKFEADFEYVTNTDSKVVFRTNKNAPNYHLIIIDFDNPLEENWKILVPEHETDVLDWTDCVNYDKLILCYIHDVKSLLRVHSLEDGQFLRDFPIDIGQVASFSGHKKLSEIFYTFVSFLNPGSIFQYDFKNGLDNQPKLFREIKLNLAGFDKSAYGVKQIFYESKDGTKIPMFIVMKNVVENMSARPCLLYGYGGFNISLQPNFSVTGLMFMDTFNGLLAFPNLRGGGEYGEKWHNSGRLLNKQNVFDDFQYAAKYLIENNYTAKKKLLIQGGSNGGLLVGACINQTPELFGAAVAQVGVMDMLRFHKFTIGLAWCSDYGNPNEKKEHFENLYKYSPVHNVHEPKQDSEEYPATLILTADHDDRVSPLHSLKFAAALQDAVRNSNYQKNPILLRVYSKAGHGAGKPTTKKIEEATDIITFAYKSLDIDTINV